MSDKNDVVIVKLKTVGALVAALTGLLAVIIPLMFQHGCFNREPMPEPESHVEEPRHPDPHEVPHFIYRDEHGNTVEQRCEGDCGMEFDKDGNLREIHKGGRRPEEERDD